MTESWRDISIDRILDSEQAITAKIHRYDRIVRYWEIEAIRDAEKQLSALEDRLRISTDRFVGVGNRIEKRINGLETQLDRASRSQGRHQIVIAFLTGILALTTVAYTWASMQSLDAMRRANDLQAQQIAIQERDQRRSDSQGEP